MTSWEYEQSILQTSKRTSDNRFINFITSNSSKSKKKQKDGLENCNSTHWNKLLKKWFFFVSAGEPLKINTNKPYSHYIFFCRQKNQNFSLEQIDLIYKKLLNKKKSNITERKTIG